jgi:hypothetical protein
MKNDLMHILRTIPVCLAILLGLPSLALATSFETSSTVLPFGGQLEMSEGNMNQAVVTLAGRFHVLSQVFEASDGTLMADVHANLAGVRATGDDGTRWDGVGAEQFAPTSINPADDTHNFSYIQLSMPFYLLELGSGQSTQSAEPSTISMVLGFDEQGRLLNVCSVAVTGTDYPPSPCDNGFDGNLTDNLQ